MLTRPHLPPHALPAGLLAALSADPTSWQQCVEQGMSTGRGSISANLNAASALPVAGWGSLAAAALAVAGALMAL